MYKMAGNSIVVDVLEGILKNLLDELSSAIGDETIDGLEYQEVVDIAKAFIDNLGGFEKFAEWGLF